MEDLELATTDSQLDRNEAFDSSDFEGEPESKGNADAILAEVGLTMEELVKASEESTEKPVQELVKASEESTAKPVQDPHDDQYSNDGRGLKAAIVDCLAGGKTRAEAYIQLADICGKNKHFRISEMRIVLDAAIAERDSHTRYVDLKNTVLLEYDRVLSFVEQKFPQFSQITGYYCADFTDITTIDWDTYSALQAVIQTMQLEVSKTISAVVVDAARGTRKKPSVSVEGKVIVNAFLLLKRGWEKYKAHPPSYFDAERAELVDNFFLALDDPNEPVEVYEDYQGGYEYPEHQQKLQFWVKERGLFDRIYNGVLRSNLINGNVALILGTVSLLCSCFSSKVRVERYPSEDAVNPKLTMIAMLIFLLGRSTEGKSPIVELLMKYCGAMLKELFREVCSELEMGFVALERHLDEVEEKKLTADQRKFMKWWNSRSNKIPSATTFEIETLNTVQREAARFTDLIDWWYKMKSDIQRIDGVNNDLLTIAYYLPEFSIMFVADEGRGWISRNLTSQSYQSAGLFLGWLCKLLQGTDDSGGAETNSRFYNPRLKGCSFMPIQFDLIGEIIRDDDSSGSLHRVSPIYIRNTRYSREMREPTSSAKGGKFDRSKIRSAATSLSDYSETTVIKALNAAVRFASAALYELQTDIVALPFSDDAITERNELFRQFVYEPRRGKTRSDREIELHEKIEERIDALCGGFLILDLIDTLAMRWIDNMTKVGGDTSAFKFSTFMTLEEVDELLTITPSHVERAFAMQVGILENSERIMRRSQRKQVMMQEQEEQKKRYSAEDYFKIFVDEAHLSEKISAWRKQKPKYSKSQLFQKKIVPSMEEKLNVLLRKRNLPEAKVLWNKAWDNA